MKTGDLPSRDGSTASVNYNRDTQMVMIDINGEQEELSVIDAIAFASKILIMTEVVLRGGE